MTRLAGDPNLLVEAQALDDADPLAVFRDRFERPEGPGSGEVVYLCGHSLGLLPRRARADVAEVLDAWAQRGVEGHFEGDRPWYGYEDRLEQLMAPMVGAAPGEVSLANALTVDLHLLMASFYRPRPDRSRVVVEAGAFPSDRYAVHSHVAWRGLDPEDHVVELAADPESGAYEPDGLRRLLDRYPDVDLVLLGGVNYHTGEVLDMAELAAEAHAAGATIGLDLAHAAGNVPLHLHEWGVDFAAWCTYKYLNGGPGSVAGYFVHERHALDVTRPRLAGWWGNDPATRFRMDEERRFVPRSGAAGWKISNPPILALAPLTASLETFAAAGPDRLRAKSIELTGRLHERLVADGFDVLTPAEPHRRGCQLSVRVGPAAAATIPALRTLGVVADHRPPDVVRLAPVPLYTSYHDVEVAARALVQVRDEVSGPRP